VSAGAQPLPPWRWLGVPMLQALAATMLFAIPLRIHGLGLPEPVFPLAVAFAWAVIRPSVLAPIGVLAMGLFLDLLWGSTFGLWAVCLLLGYGVALAGRSMMAGQSRTILWAWFAGVTALAMVAGDLITMLDVRAIPDPVGVGWQFLATIMLYPFANRLIERFEDADVRFR
jgi:rod shape-determining protein MreD